MTAKILFSKTGFSLVELVVVIMLVTILSVMVGPKLLMESSVDTYALRDEVIAKMRETQILAMNNADRIYQIDVTDKGYQSAYYVKPSAKTQINEDSFTKSAALFKVLGQLQLFPNNTSLTLIGNNNIHPKYNIKQFSLNFDSQGRVEQCSVSKCIQVNGGEPLNILVEPQGYIHAEK